MSVAIPRILTINNLSQHIKINVVEFVDIQSRDGFTVFPEPRIKFLRAFEFLADIERHVGFTRRKTGSWHDAGSTSLISIVVLAKTNDRRPPHDRTQARHLFVEVQRNQRVSATSRAFHAGNELVNRC